MRQLSRLPLFVFFFLAFMQGGSLRAATGPTAAIVASPSNGIAPLGVSFDASSSSADSVSFLWQFGDGTSSTAKIVTHVYVVAGTYIATLTVANGAGVQSISQISIVVAGNGAGPVTDHMNFRIAPSTSSFKVNFNKPDRDVFNFQGSFNTVDLPGRLNGLAASFSINNSFTVSGIVNVDSLIVNSPKLPKPSFTILINQSLQTLQVFITKANLAAALAASGITPNVVTPPGGKVPVTLTLNIGAESYTFTMLYSYSASAGVSGRGVYNLARSQGDVQDGFFVVAVAAALESLSGTSHTYAFDTFLSRPNGAVITTPTSGSWTFTFNGADPIVVPFDRFKQKDKLILYDQLERGLGGIATLRYNTLTRHLLIQTWDILAASTHGGTGLPVRGDPFLAFNFTLRADLDQPDGTTLHAVTATRLTRRARDDAFWRTGRRKPRK